MTTAAVLFAEGFEEIEAISIVDVLRRAEFNVIAAGIADSTVAGAHQLDVGMDCLLADVQAEQLDAVVLPGGLPGAENLRDAPAVLELLRAVAASGKVVAAICAAPIALHAAGLLDGKRVTCYPSFEAQMPAANYTGARVEVDGKIVTGAGPGAAIEFALELVAQLASPDKAAELRRQMLAE